MQPAPSAAAQAPAAVAGGLPPPPAPGPAPPLRSWSQKQGGGAINTGGVRKNRRKIAENCGNTAEIAALVLGVCTLLLEGTWKNHQFLSFCNTGVCFELLFFFPTKGPKT